MQITIREPGSAITHFIGMMMAVFAAVPLLVKASAGADGSCLAAMTVFMISMVLLYGASATYHSLSVSEKVIRIFRKIDHMMIFVLIAGTYTPVCVSVQRRLYASGRRMGHCNSGNGYQGTLDYLSEMVFLRPLYRYGLGLYRRIRTAVERTSACRFPLASGRRHHLYNRRYHLCLKASHFQFQTCKFRFP